MSKIAIYFPGIGYHCDKPLLYYCRKIACEMGYENYRTLGYTYSGGNIRGNIEKMKEAYEALFAQAQVLLEDIKWSEYNEILFVSKSIGTIISSAYAKKHGLVNVKHILYTPLEQTFEFVSDNAIGFIGTEDPWSSIDEIINLAKTKGILLNVYEGCNHSLECADTMKNLDILNDVMKKTKEYLV